MAEVELLKRGCDPFKKSVSFYQCLTLVQRLASKTKMPSLISVYQNFPHVEYFSHYGTKTNMLSANIMVTFDK